LNAQRNINQWAVLKHYDSFVLSANHHLESGHRIEEFLIDLPTSFTISPLTGDWSKDFASGFITGPSIGIYTSAYGNARHAHYDGWDQDKWSDFIQKLHERLGKRHTFVIIGAPYDQNLSEMVAAKLEARGIPYKMLIGHSLARVVEVLKMLNYFVGFPSGLSILNEMLGKDGVMFYGKHVVGIMHGWTDQRRIKEGRIIETLFCSPDQLLDRMEKVGVLRRI
jgi:ADP-heptose:LPS heptosyltransferase